MLSTPRLTLGGWLGHDDNRPLAKGAGHYRNAKYMAYLVNAIQQAEPGIWGNDRFNLDPSVTKSQVLRSTGQKPGKVSINDKEIELSGSTVTSYWVIAWVSAPVGRCCLCTNFFSFMQFAILK